LSLANAGMTIRPSFPEFRGGLPRYYTVYSITIQYYYTALLYSMTIQYYYTILLYSITIQYYYTILLYSITIQYYYTISL